jgi:hypothetical protein
VTLSPLLARLAPAWPVLRDHWKLAAVALLALVAALGVRGCSREADRADTAERTANVERDQLQAQFTQALDAAKGESRDLKARLEAAQAQGAQPVAVFEGTSGPQKVPPPKKPAAQESAQKAPAATAGTPHTEGPGTQAGGGGQGPALPPLCVLAVGDEFDAHVIGAQFKKKDGGHFIVAEVRLDGDDGEILRATATGPVTLPPPDPTPATDLHVPASWGAGLAVSTLDGGSAGPLAALPPLRFWGVSLETALGATVSRAGSVQFLGTGIVRW